jgi:hypothetical protein
MPRTVFEFAVGARRHQRDVLADVSHLDATSVDRERPRNVRQIWRTNRVSVECCKSRGAIIMSQPRLGESS